MKMVGLMTLSVPIPKGGLSVLTEREIEERLIRMAKRATLAQRRKEIREAGQGEMGAESVSEPYPPSREAE
ncbi:hypothetical protein LCGC14_1128040 [marine sediment metagenome]|uniref:Uncharacterized protein n=1 Tax=marine sediment metagenome TaxID=412755 RepID=A0A0F9M6Q0_9ZZZZ